MVPCKRNLVSRPLRASSLTQGNRNIQHTQCATPTAVRLAGDLHKKPTDSASLDQLLQRIKEQLIRLAPIIDLEVTREPEGARTERGGSQTIEHGRRSTA
jgi:hypothetical protein